jgi:hypothetical protein
MAAHLLKLPAGSIIACDRAYNDYALFSQWTEAGVFFVTRLKDNAVFEIVEERAVPQHRNILRDQIIRLAAEPVLKTNARTCCAVSWCGIPSTNGRLCC